MGKRAAAKPKATGAPGAKRARGGAAAAAVGVPWPPPPSAPEYWARPAPREELLLGTKEAIRLFVVDVEECLNVTAASGAAASSSSAPAAAAAAAAGAAGAAGAAADAPTSGASGDGAPPPPPSHELRLYGVTAEGHSVCARLQDVRPYFYALCGGGDSAPDIAKLDLDAVRTSLGAVVAKEAGPSAVVGVEAVRRTPALGFQPEAAMLKVTVRGPKQIAPCLRALEQGLRLPAATGAGGGVELQSSATFEANVTLVLRFLVDLDLGGGRWLELPADSYSQVPQNDRATSSQIEVLVAEGAAGLGAAAAAVPMHDDERGGSTVPPVRTLCLQALVDADGRIGACAAALAVQGESRLHARAVWLLAKGIAPPEKSAEEWSEVTCEVYDPGAAEAPKVFASHDEAALLEHLGKTLELLDPDIIVSHDFLQTARGLLGPKGSAKSGSALARGLSRRFSGAEVKLTAKSGEVSGISGRLVFDLQKQVEKEHRLTDYSLGHLLQTFCKEPLPELREAALARLRASRPRAYAGHALRQAEASVKVFDHLAFLYNFIEMARVTGCPLGYLLERGQAVKVQAQLLREARRRGFVLPSQRPGTGEETSFEGATVLEPKVGFYRCPVAVLDFASLYPSIMMAHNLCYSTLLPQGAEQRPGAPAHAAAPPPGPGAGGGDDLMGGEQRRSCFVDAEVRRGLLPSILEQLLSARKAAKKELALCPATDATRRKVLHGRQLALKLSANSVYGFTGAMNGPMPCLELAGAVTAYGREMIRATKERVEAHFCRAKGYKHDAEVVYGDTDSVMVRFGPEDELSVEDACRLSREAAEVCTAAFTRPVQLEFEKVYRPFLLMAKKRYAGLSWSRAADPDPQLETKGIETVRRDWSDLVRHGLERALQLLLRKDGGDGSAEALAFVRGLCDDLRQGKVDFRSLVISKSIGRDEYATKTPHSEVAEKLRKRDPSSAPSLGDRVSYLVLAGAAKAKVFERAEDPLFALEHELPVDAEYYLENQLKQPLVRVFEHICGDPQKAEQALFGTGNGQKVVVTTAAAPSFRGLGKFMKAKPKCLACGAASATSEGAAFCGPCAELGEGKAKEVREAALIRARELRAKLQELRDHCAVNCSMPSGDFAELPADSAGGAGRSGGAGGEGGVRQLRLPGHLPPGEVRQGPPGRDLQPHTPRRHRVVSCPKRSHVCERDEVRV